MLITRETDYALRILSRLSGGEKLTAGQICESEQVPQQFGYKILKKLAKGGIVEISRGSEGGCRVVGDLKMYSLYDLMQIMEEDSRVSACMCPGYVCDRRKMKGGHCDIHCSLARIQRVLDEETKKYSLYEMIGGSGR